MRRSIDNISHLIFGPKIQDETQRLNVTNVAERDDSRTTAREAKAKRKININRYSSLESDIGVTKRR